MLVVASTRTVTLAQWRRRNEALAGIFHTVGVRPRGRADLALILQAQVDGRPSPRSKAFLQIPTNAGSGCWVECWVGNPRWPIRLIFQYNS